MKPPSLQANLSQEYFYQKLLKSVKICQSYWQKFIGMFLWPTVYTVVHKKTTTYWTFRRFSVKPASILTKNAADGNKLMHFKAV